MLISERMQNLAVEIEAELERARAKFPSHANLGWALLEEIGELAKSVLHQDPPDAQRREAVQVIAVAIRVIEEGDASLDLSDEGKQR